MKTKDQKKELLASLRFKPMGSNQAYMMRNFHTFMIEMDGETDEEFVNRLNDYFMRNKDKERVGFDKNEFVVGDTANEPVMNFSLIEKEEITQPNPEEFAIEEDIPEIEDGEENITEDDLPFSEFEPEPKAEQTTVSTIQPVIYTCMQDNGKEQMNNKGIFTIVLDKPLFINQVVAIANERTVRAVFCGSGVIKTKEGYYKHLMQMLPYGSKKDFPARVLTVGGELIHVGLATKIERKNGTSGQIISIEYNEHPEPTGVLPIITDEVITQEIPAEEAVADKPETNIVNENTTKEAPQPVIKKKRGRPKKSEKEATEKPTEQKFEPVPKYVQPTLSEGAKIDDDTWQKMVKNPPIQEGDKFTYNTKTQEIKKLSKEQCETLKAYEKSTKPGATKSPVKVFEDNSVSIWDLPSTGIEINWKEVEPEEVPTETNEAIPENKEEVVEESLKKEDVIKQYDLEIENEQYIFLCDELKFIPLPLIKRVSYNGNRYYTRQEKDGRIVVLTSGTTAIADGYKDSFDALSKWRNEQILLGKDPDKYARLRADFGTIMHYIYSLYVMKQEIPLSRGKLREMIEKLPNLKVDKDNLSFILNSEKYMQELTWDIICFAKFIEDYNVEPLFTELMLSSTQYKVGSAIDFGCRMNWGVDKDGILCNPLTRKTAEIVRINAIIDFKSNNSGSFFDEHALQLHLYKRMIEENFGAILVVDKLFNFSPKDMVRASSIGYNLKDQTDSNLKGILDEVLSMAEFKHVSKKKMVVNFRGSIKMGADNKLESKIMSDELENILNR